VHYRFIIETPTGVERVMSINNAREVAADPERRLNELMNEYELAHRCMPLWNDPQRLPTD